MGNWAWNSAISWLSCSASERKAWTCSITLKSVTKGFQKFTVLFRLAFSSFSWSTYSAPCKIESWQICFDTHYQPECDVLVPGIPVSRTSLFDGIGSGLKKNLVKKKVSEPVSKRNWYQKHLIIGLGKKWHQKKS